MSFSPKLFFAPGSPWYGPCAGWEEHGRPPAEPGDLAALFFSLLVSVRCCMKIAGLILACGCGRRSQASSTLGGSLAGHIDQQRAHGLHCLGRRTSTDRSPKDVRYRDPPRMLWCRIASSTRGGRGFELGLSPQGYEEPSRYLEETKTRNNTILETRKNYEEILQDGPSRKWCWCLVHPLCKWY